MNQERVRSILRAGTGKPIAAFWTLSLLASLDTLTLCYTHDGVIVTGIVLGYLILAFSLQGALLHLIARSRALDRATPLLVAAVVAANLVSVKLAFNAEVLSFGPLREAGLLLAVTLILYILLTRRWEVQKRILLFVGVSSVAFSTMVSSGVYSRLQRLLVGDGGSFVTLSRYEGIRLKDKPNFHVISFDSMIPDAVARRELGVSVSYQTYLEGHAVVYRNAFSPAVPSIPSLNGLLRLDDQKVLGDKFFAGGELSPVFAIFRANGYAIATGFTSQYLGAKGQHVDVYRAGIPFPFERTTLCLDAESRFWVIPKVWGLCKRAEVDEYFKPNLEGAMHEWRSEVRSIITSKRTRPVFTYHYVYDPIGHTPLEFMRESTQLANYRKYFSGKAVELSTYLEELQSDIMRADPNALVMIFGDHGVYLGRGEKYSDGPEDYILDRHAISLSVLSTNHECSRDRPAISKYVKSYATPSRVLAGLIRCVAESPEAVDSAVLFDDVVDFDKFIYE